MSAHGFIAHTPDPTKYHDARESGYTEARHVGGQNGTQVVNAPRNFGGVILARQDPIRTGMSAGCDPHDPRNHEMVIDPHLGGTRRTNHSMMAGDAGPIFQEELRRAAQQGLSGDDLQREAALRTEERMLEMQQTRQPLNLNTLETMEPEPVRPMVKTAGPRSNSIPTAPPTRASMLQRFEAAPAMRTVAAPQAGPVIQNPEVLTEPDVQVLFEIPGVGENESWYHEVKFEQAGSDEKVGFLILICDNRYRGHKYFPPAIEGGIGVEIVGRNQVYKAHVPGIKFTHENKTFCVLFVEDTIRGE